MNYINKAVLTFIIPIHKILNSNYAIEDSRFISMLKEIQKDEFDEDTLKNTERFLLRDFTMLFERHRFKTELYASNFTQYSSCLIYLRLHIENEMTLDEFARLINSKNIIKQKTDIECSVIELFYSYNIDDEDVDEIFLFTQLVSITPEMPKDYHLGLEYIDLHKQAFHQILLRSDTHSDDLRIDNHSQNFESISNFYGSIDMCSPINLVQIYQYPIKSVCIDNKTYDLDHRACWWLVMTDIIFLQKSLLEDTLNKVDLINTQKHKNKEKKISSMGQIEQVLINMQSFWYFQDYNHEITKKAVDKVKSRLGVDTMLERALIRLENMENCVLREINEEQNKYNFFLNIILLIIAIVQIVPIINGILMNIRTDSGVVNLVLVIGWIQSLFISVSFPLAIWTVANINKRRSKRRDELILIQNNNRRSY